MTASDSDGGSAFGSVVAQPSVGALSVRGDTALAPFPEYVPTVTAPPEQAPAGLDPRRLLHAIRRRWFPALVIGSLFAPLVALPAWFLAPKGYEAVVWLQMRAESGMLGSNASGYDQYRKTQIQLLKSPFVLNAALRRPGIADLPTIREQPAPADWLAKNLVMSAPTESEVVTLRLRGPIAEDTAKILNAVTACYLDDIVNKDRAERLGKRDTLEKKYKENQSELRTRKETYNEMARTLGSLSNSEVVTQRGLLMDHLTTLRSEVVMLENDISRIDTELAIGEGLKAEAAGEDFDADDLANVAVDRDPAVAELKDRLRVLGQSISEQTARSARGANEPAVKRLRAQRNDIAERIDLRKAELRPTIANQLSIDTRGGQPGRTRESPAVLQLRRKIIAAEFTEVKSQFDKVANDVTLLGNLNADLELRKSEIANLQSVTDRIGNELETTSIDISMPNRVTLMEEASVPSGSDQLVRMMMSILAGGAAFVVGGGGIVLIEFLRNRLSSPEEMTQRVGIRVLGTLPKLSRSRRSASEAVVAESMDAIRTLVLQAGRQPPKVILVTSAVEQEGKTTVASRLAASLARSDKRTLLLDGDLRHPNVHLALELEIGTGLSEVLRGEISVDEAIQPSAIEGLFAMTAGQCDYAAVTALSRPELGKAFKQLRESFDHVVIDAGPALAFADALLLGQQCDIAIVTALKDYSGVPNINAAIERLRAVGIRVVGTVINGVKESGPRRLYASPLPS